MKFIWLIIGYYDYGYYGYRYCVVFIVVMLSLISYSFGIIILFIIVKMNYGNVYNSGNYCFIVFFNGLYVFFWSIVIYISYYGNIKLMKNGFMY